MTHEGRYEPDIDIAESGVAAAELEAFIGRIERLDDSAKALNEDRKEVYVEAKNRGFDTKAMKRIVAMRRLDTSDRLEQEAILALYMTALGMS